MKRFIALCLVSLVIVSCKSTSATNTKVDSSVQSKMKGNWTIASVNYPGADVIKVNSFDLTDSKCLIGSQWHLVANNNKGNMAINNPKCTAYTTPITWFVNKEGQFVLKILDETKAKKMKSGYVLRIANQTDSSFQLIDKINVGGKDTDVVYQFNKVN